MVLFIFIYTIMHANYYSVLSRIYDYALICFNFNSVRKCLLLIYLDLKKTTLNTIHKVQYISTRVSVCNSSNKTKV